MKRLSLFLIFIFFNLSLFANVKLNAPDFFLKGEPYTFELEALGSYIKFPKVKDIDGFMVEDLGTSRSLQIINGNYDEKITKRFKIVPTRNFTIPSFTFGINAKDVKTKAKKVVAKKIEKTNSSNFDLTLRPSKRTLYVGEDLIVTLIFKYKKGLEITNLGFEPPHFDNFWYQKKDGSSKRYEQNGFIVQELDFLLFPQKSGTLSISPLRVDVQMIANSRSSSYSFFSKSSKLVKVYSNELKFNVRELPNGAKLIGDFDLKTSVNKTRIKHGESISYRYNISGVGNIDDMEDIKLDIPNATIYDNKPEINTRYTKNGYEGSYTKVFSIVPNGSLTIPSIEFKYFSKKRNRIITRKTKAYKIIVEGTKEKKVILEKPKETIEEKKEVVSKKYTSLSEKITYFLLGIIFTLLIFGLYWLVKLQKVKKIKVDTPLSKLVKKAKTKDDLIKVLLPYLKLDMEFDNLIFDCQKEDKEFKILKKQILKKIKSLKI